DYWRRTLADLRLFELPTDRPRPPVQTGNGGICSEPLEAPVAAAWERLAVRHACTPDAVVLGALLVALHRSTNETDLAIGLQVSSREDGRTDRLIGAFGVPLVVRADLSGDPRFDELIGRVQRITTEAVAHAAMPFEQIVDLVRSSRDASRHPLFTIDFRLRPRVRDADPDAPPGLHELPPLAGGAVVDLGFSMSQGTHGWTASCVYNTDVFEAGTAARLLHGFLNVLRSAVADDRQPLSRLSLLDEAERRMLVEDWNRTDATFPAHRTVPELFAEQAALAPDAHAVVAGTNRLTYRQLDEASNRLAAELVARGVGPGMLAGFFLTRSTDLVIALMAILKCGAAYVPLDPSNPPQRLAYIVGDAQLAALITRESLAGRLEGVDAPTILLDRDAAILAARPSEALPRRAGPDDLAYVIYTSGSTGKPKGVQIHHRALTNFLWSVRRAPGLEAGDRHVGVTTIAFDVATMDVLLPLIVGATLILATEEEALCGDELLQLLKRERATSMFATPVTYQLLLAAGWQGEPRPRMQCGGEAIPRALADALIARGAELWNIYGPTETTIYSITGRIEAGSGPVLLGRAVANTQLYVLDAHRQPVPPGVAGELWIGGVGVGRGYLRRPELTDEKFVPDPFRAVPGARLYRTGDIVRMRSPEHIEFLGRADTQIKLRGFRIELGEIEEVLRVQPGVAEAVAIVGQDAAGENALWGYVVPNDAAPPPEALVDGLNDALRRALPRYMCPSALSVLPALPRLPNGKLDRRALPPPVAASPAPVAVPDGGLSDTQARIAAIWRGILDIADIPRDGNFFELGGHSLLAVRMLARVEAEFGTRLSLSALFRAPRLDELAAQLEQKVDREFDFRPVVKLQPNGTRMPLIAINNTGIYYGLAKHLGADQPFTSLQLFSPDRVAGTLPGTFEEIAAGYVELIRGLHPAGPYALLGWCVAGTLAYEIARQLEGQGETVRSLVIIDAWAPGWNRGLPRARAWAAGASFRWQLLAHDCRRLWSGEERLATFLERRPTLGRWLHAIGIGRDRAADEAHRRKADPAYDYDQRLLAHLEKAVEGYAPQPRDGAMLLLRSASEPHGRFLDARMGWGRWARGGVDVRTIAGDHFTMFREPGVAQMAEVIRASMDAATGR
ncbi:MAG TPA: amino acid adenylation domain-containing protein, partial [Nevskiaceae bacterium]|nr:amino acid adenylation domain-containing protein [Nevskiaceae bacterium]